MAAGEQFMQKRTQAEYIGARIQVLATDLFRDM